MKKERHGSSGAISPFSILFCYLLLDFNVKTGARFSLRDKRIIVISEVEITRVDYISEDTQEMLLSRSTAYPRCQKKKDMRNDH